MSRPLGVRINFAEIRKQIRSGAGDRKGCEQRDQYATTARAVVAMAKTYLADGYDVVIDEVFTPTAFDTHWKAALSELSWHLVILRPTLDALLARTPPWEQRSLASHTKRQHEATGKWARY